MPLMAAVCAQGEDITLGVYSALSTPALTFNTGTGYSHGIRYRANNNAAPGLKIQVGPYGMEASPSLFGTSTLDPEYAPTRFFDAKLFYLGGEWGGEAYYQYFRGFYSETRTDPAVPENPSMFERTFDLNVYKALTPGSRVYRMMEPLPNTGLDLNLYYLFGVSSVTFHSPGPVLDTLPEARGTPFETMRRLTAYGPFVALGGTLNMNLFGLYLDPTLFIGFGAQNRYSDVYVSPSALQTKVSLKLNTGFRADHFNLGMKAENDANAADLGKYGVLFHSVNVKLELDIYL